MVKKIAKKMTNNTKFSKAMVIGIVIGIVLLLGGGVYWMVTRASNKSMENSNPWYNNSEYIPPDGTCKAHMYFQYVDGMTTAYYQTYDGKNTGMKSGTDAGKVITEAIDAVATTEREKHACAKKYISAAKEVCGEFKSDHLPSWMKRVC